MAAFLMFWVLYEKNLSMKLSGREKKSLKYSEILFN